MVVALVELRKGFRAETTHRMEASSEFIKEIRRLKRTGADVRWSARDHLHVTLRFLGEVPEDRIEAVGKMLDAACVGRA